MCLQSQHPSQRRIDEVMKLLLNPSINSGQAHRLHVRPLWVFRYDFIKIYKRINSPLFLWSVLLGFLSCFPSLLGKNTLTHTISFYRNLNFGYRQDTTQAVLVVKKMKIVCKWLLQAIAIPFVTKSILLTKASIKRTGLSATMVSSRLLT